MHGIKLPQQDFALKRQGGLMREGSVFVGHYSTALKVCVISSVSFSYIKSYITHDV